MSIYTTVTVTRSKALRMMVEKMTTCGLSNEKLEDILFGLYAEETLNNFNVINDEESCED